MFFSAVLDGKNPIDPAYLVGPEHHQRPSGAIQIMYQRYMMQAIAQNMRVTLDSNTSQEFSGSITTSINGTLLYRHPPLTAPPLTAPSFNPTMSSSVKTANSNSSTKICLLPCSHATYLPTYLRMTCTTPRPNDPNSIAGTASFFLQEARCVARTCGIS